jgi:hypothetical protein
MADLITQICLATLLQNFSNLSSTRFIDSVEYEPGISRCLLVQ